ncbi:MAG: GNAT family N-acetyltransferase [Prevotellaceae bacterium]|jgi:putative hemolysin|nr:GNAT family N-acetyltransferase [Prevotellaceae bacterium]
MEPTLAPIDKKLIERELTLDKFVRYTNNGGNLLYVVNYHDSPNVMQEIGRLREISFRAAGGGTGKNVDIDEFDTAETNYYHQLIVWDTKAKEILGGYRYIHAGKCEIKDLATAELFHFSDKFIEEYKPYTIELGRSFVQPNYQSTRLRSKGLYALDNLWDGLGALVVKYPDVNYFLGKVTMYGTYNIEARDILLYFLRKHFSDNENLIIPIHPLLTHPDLDKLEQLFTGSTYKEDYKILSKEIRSHGENIPPLINSYMNLSPSMKVFGTAINHNFGDVEETGILIKISDIYAEKIERYVGTIRKMMHHHLRWFKR